MDEYKTRIQSALKRHLESGIQVKVMTSQDEKEILDTCTDLGFLWLDGEKANEWVPKLTHLPSWTAYFLTMDIFTERLIYMRFCESRDSDTSWSAIRASGLPQFMY